MIPVYGVLAVEGWSENGKHYYAARLKELHGVSVPILWMHQGSPEKVTDKIPEDKIIGHCTVYWNGQCLLYVGEVKDEFKWCVKLAKGTSIGVFHESIPLFASLFEHHAAGKMKLVEVSLVTACGIPSAEYYIHSDWGGYWTIKQAVRERK